MNKSDGYICFSVKSNGEYSETNGYVGFPGSEFSPDEITNIVKQSPSKCWSCGDNRKNAYSPNNKKRKYMFSSWKSKLRYYNLDNQYDEIIKMVRELNLYANQLQEFKKRYDVLYEIEVVLYNLELGMPDLFFDAEIIAFCYKTKTEIRVVTMLANNSGLW